MTEKNKVIIEKLEGIDHRLDVDSLWSELEHKLPPEKSKRRFGVLWFLLCGLVIGGLSVALYGELAGDHIQSELSDDGSSTSMQVDQQIASNERVASEVSQANKGSKMSQEGEDKSALEISNADDKRNLTKEGRIDNTPGNINQISAVQSAADEVSEAISKTKLTKQNTTNEKSGNTVAAPTSVQSYNKQSQSPSSLSENTKTILLDRLTPTELNLEAPDSNKPLSAERLLMAYSPVSRLQISHLDYDHDIRKVAPLVTDMILPKRTPKRWSFGLHASYGRMLDQAESVTFVDRSLFDAGSMPKDVVGVGLNLGYEVGKNWGLDFGVIYDVYTDAAQYIEISNAKSESLANGGFLLSNQALQYTRYLQSKSLDVAMGAHYAINVGRWSLMPSAGLLYNSYFSSEKLLNVPTQVNNSEQIGGFSNEKINLPASNSLGYYGGLSLGYNLSQSIQVQLAGRVLSTRTVDSEQFQAKLSPQVRASVGLKYRF